MKINILEFTVKDHLFGLRTEYIKNIFDIENVQPAPLMPDYVAGVTTHGRHVYPLICMERILELDGQCKNLTGKTAITVDVDGRNYALVVDEIHKIQEIEKTGKEDDVINFYNLKGEVLEEITPQFLKRKIRIPAFRQSETAFQEELSTIEKKEDEESFLIFKAGDRFFGVNTDFIKKVEYIENLSKTAVNEDSWIEGVYLLRKIPVKAGNIKKLFNIENGEGEFLIILEKDRKLFGLIADDIIDIYTVKISKINRGSYEQAVLKDFVVYDNRVVPVLSERFITETLEKYSLETAYEEEQTSTEKKNQIDILLFRIGEELLGIKMENVDEVLEYSDVHISNYPTEIKAIKGLIATGKESLFLISYEEFLGQRIDTDSEDTKILIMKDDDLKIALLISDIEDILVVPEENFAEVDSEELFIRGTVMDRKGNLINVINPKWALFKYREKRLTEG
ncbi:chemotaxis protein CheW [Persephonella sp.]